MFEFIQSTLHSFSNNLVEWVTAVMAFITWLIEKRNQTARELLLEALEIQSQKEAWILVGPNSENIRLSCLKTKLKTKESQNKLYLQNVEIRAILDQSQWNKPNNIDVYDILDFGRTWYIRDEVWKHDDISYTPLASETDLTNHPAIISSKGMEELCAWIERASSLWTPYPFPFKLLPNSTLEMLKPLALSVCSKDRRKVFGKRLSIKATRFLEWYDKKYNSNNNTK